MPCPLFKNETVCLAERGSLYVPSRDVELLYCSTENYPTCSVYRRAVEDWGQDRTNAAPENPERAGREA